jgi:hypothetical protein
MLLPSPVSPVLRRKKAKPAQVKSGVKKDPVKFQEARKKLFKNGRQPPLALVMRRDKKWDDKT